MKIIGKVKYPTKEVREDENGYNISFLMDYNTLNVPDKRKFEETWFKIVMGKTPENKSSLELIRKTLKGAEVEFENLLGTCIDFKVLKVTENKAEAIPNMIKIAGKDYMTYAGLLKKAHEKGNFDMVITESWVSEDMKMAWCKVRLTSKAHIFDGFGSSTPENTGIMTQTHPVEMSHTRAKGRALRDYLNIGEVMAEELSSGKTN